jgi:hypothetical protein
LHDPAWPALYQLDEHQRAVAERARDGLAVDTARQLASDDVLDRMLGDGLLVGRLGS